MESLIDWIIFGKGQVLLGILLSGCGVMLLVFAVLFILNGVGVLDKNWLTPLKFLSGGGWLVI